MKIRLKHEQRYLGVSQERGTGVEEAELLLLPWPPFDPRDNANKEFSCFRK